MQTAVKNDWKISFDEALSFFGIDPATHKFTYRKGKKTFRVLCPIHDDKNPSMDVTEKEDGTAQFTCYNPACCGDLEASKDFMKKIRKLFRGEKVTRLPRAKKQVKDIKLLPLTLQELADEKGIPFDNLRKFGLYESVWTDREAGTMTPCVVIPSFTMDGEIHKKKQARMLQEITSDDGQKEIKKAIKRMGNGELIPYGLNHLADARSMGQLLIVEGESDCWTLWHHDFPALGIPGSKNAKLLKADYLEGIRSLYIINEKDSAAREFIRSVKATLQELQWDGEMHVITMPDGCKDPNELHLQLQDTAQFIMQMGELIAEAPTFAAWNEQEKAKEEAVATAEVINLNEKRQEKTTANTLGAIFENLPEELHSLQVPSNWNLGYDGIQAYGKEGWFTVTRQPVFISRSVDRLDDKKQKKVELTFLYRKQWKTILVDRNTISNGRKILDLANDGIRVTSNNAKYLVSFFDAFDSLNEMDVPHTSSVAHIGWVGKDTFVSNLEDSPYYIDIAPEEKWRLKAYTNKGSFDAWKEGIAPYLAVNDNDKAVYPYCQSIIFAYFASPMLEMLNAKSFTYHSYALTGGGKSASNYLGASVWGNPEDLKISLDSTQFSLETVMHRVKNLPIFADELQSISAKKRNEVIQRLLYTISNDASRGRGSKDGSLQEVKNWKLIFITSGEHALLGSESQGGAMNRALEVYGKPIPDAQLAKKAYLVAQKNYGHAGRVFVDKLIELGKDELNKLYNSFVDEMESQSSNEHSPHHINMVAILSLAAYLVKKWIFEKAETQAMTEAAILGVQLLEGVEKAANIDDSERARQYIADWFYSNQKNHFDKDCMGEKFGFIADGYVCVVPRTLKAALKEGGFDPLRTLKDWKAKGWTKTNGDRIDAKMKEPGRFGQITVIAIEKKQLIEN
jgi:putative DNA primase/helicase